MVEGLDKNVGSYASESSGRYRVRSTWSSSRRGQFARFVANKGYFGGAPKIDEIRFPTLHQRRSARGRVEER